MSNGSRPSAPGPDAVERVFRDEHARAIATLVRAFGDVEAAEDAVQDAFAIALDRWPMDGLPANPGGWITTTARRRAIDQARRRARGRELLRDTTVAPTPGSAEEAFPDERLALICMCCHPALAPDAQVALTLRLVAGLDPATIARAFLVGDEAIAQRLARARRKIRDARIPFRAPSAAELEQRLAGVLATIALIATTGWRDAAIACEATRLARLVATLTAHPEALGLLALLRLQDSRAAARTDQDGVAIPLPDQDRTRWDGEAIIEALGLLRRCETHARAGPYQVQAAIQATHAVATSTATTDWPHILALYDLLHELAPTPVVALNRAVARAQIDGPAAALADIDVLSLQGYAPFHAARAHMLLQLRSADAADAFSRAADLAPDEAERRYLRAAALRAARAG